MELGAPWPSLVVQGGQGNRLKGSVSGEPRCRLCALITLRAVHSDLEFAAPRDADLPDEGRAYVEHVTTPDSLRERSATGFYPLYGAKRKATSQLKAYA